MTSFFDEATESSPVLCLAFSSGSRYLCSGGADHFIRVWDLKHKKLIRTFKVCFSFSFPSNPSKF